MSEMVSHVAIDQDMRHPKLPKVEGARIDGSIYEALWTSSPRLSHRPNIKNEVILKNKDLCVSQKTPHFSYLGKI
jgi:hypothetical protein